MCIREVIYVLNNAAWLGSNDDRDKIEEAVRIAVKILSNTFESDLISRQAAIDACIRVREYRAYDEIEEIKALPSAQSERQKGEWIDYTEDGYVECPFCHSATNCDGNKDELHFCFSCGADMRGKQDG